MADGSWRYDYYQEGADPAQRDEEYTNRGLVACMEDGVPVAVLPQDAGQAERPLPRARPSRVRRWKDGWFSLEGIPAGGDSEVARPCRLETNSRSRRSPSRMRATPRSPQW
ncbi:MAG: hypothetical protein U5L11_01010 [Arhodomonas sp.]|nr:hypothetical protein [Arhodomonas sp.]